jgi:hypothetical protein
MDPEHLRTGLVGGLDVVGIEAVKEVSARGTASGNIPGY